MRKYFREKHITSAYNSLNAINKNCNLRLKLSQAKWNYYLPVKLKKDLEKGKFTSNKDIIIDLKLLIYDFIKNQTLDDRV